MEDNSKSPGYLPVKVKSEKQTILECINKVLAGQLLKTMRARTSQCERFDASPEPLKNKVEHDGIVLPINIAGDNLADKASLP